MAANARTPVSATVLAPLLALTAISATCRPGTKTDAPATGASTGGASVVTTTAAGGQGPGAPGDGCSGPAVATNGRRKLALVVGVGQYLSPEIPALEGPPHDVQKIYDLLTGPGGYGFPPQNVCKLVDGAATVQGFRKAFEEALVARAQPGDVVVIYDSSHGSQQVDVSGDEPNGMDDTWVLHDSRTAAAGDLVDDEVFDLLARLHAKTPNITVILDSCNSGSAIRAAGLRARRVPPQKLAPGAVVTARAAESGPPRDVLEAPRQLPGLVLLAAARDGTPAFEVDGRGIFTDALLRVLSRSGTPLTYDQVQSQVRPLVAAESSQVPFFAGAIDRVVFGDETRAAPLALRVAAVGAKLTLRGPPVPGVGPGAELRVYDGATTGAAVSDPARSIATVVVEGTNGLEASARIVARGPAPGALQEGDLAVLARPAPERILLHARILDVGPGAVPAARAAAIRDAIQRNPDARDFVRLDADRAAQVDLELSLAPDDVLELRDTTYLLRARYPGGTAEAASVAANLAAHARQRALLALVPEGGAQLVEGKTIKVRIVPRADKDQLACKQGSFREPEGAEPYHVPMCFRYVVEVELAEGAPPMLVGGLFLSASGKIVALVDQLDELLMPGRKKVLGGIVTGPPDGARDTILVIGTLQGNPIRLDLLATSGGLRGKAPDPGKPEGLLQRSLRRYLRETRSGDADSPAPEDSAWTRTVLPVVVRANPEFAPPPLVTPGAPAPRGDPRSREYTLPTFDIRPYLPRDPSAALSKFLLKADWLAHASKTDGIGYKQHPWTASTDAENLRIGIDCSRAVHFAFTRAGLRYNGQTGPGAPNGRYLTTAEMALADGPMKDEFDRCDGEALRTGDVLVYRDDGQGDGHTVVVIDPAARVGWNSAGWDGNAKPGIPGDTGVEYQKIKFKPDWERWDRRSMTLKACWRYRRFTEEAARPDGRPGSWPVENACQKLGCGLVPPS